MNQVLIITSKDEQFGRYFVDNGIKVVDVWKNNHFSSRKYNFLKFFNSEDLLFAFNKELIMKYNKILITETNEIVSIVRNIKRWNEQASIKYWLWNPMKQYPSGKKEYVAEIAKFGVETFSFDNDDCRKYGLHYNNQMCPDYSNFINDYNVKAEKCFFIGADKGRLKKLINIKKTLESIDIDFDFTVFSQKNITENINGIKIIKKPVDYSTILDGICKSTCIIDIVQEGQSGLTWRPFEALFYNKKLITTNTNIKEFDFYNKNNILVLEDNYDEIKDFLALPYIQIDEKIKDGYRLEKWIANFFEEA